MIQVCVFFCGTRDDFEKFSATFFPNFMRCLSTFTLPRCGTDSRFSPISLVYLWINRETRKQRGPSKPSRRRKERGEKKREKKIKTAWKKVGKFLPRQGSGSCAREELLPRGIFQSGRKGKKIELLSTDIDQAFFPKLRLSPFPFAYRFYKLD